MKKIYGVLLTVALVATMVMPGLAAPTKYNSQNTSPITSPVAPSKDPVYDPASASSPSTTTSKTVTEVVPATLTGVLDAKTMPTVNIFGLEAKMATVRLAEEVMSVVAMPSVLRDLGVAANASLLSVMEFSYDGVIPAGGIQIPMTISAASVGDLIYVLHRQASGQWEKVAEGVLGADLTIVATFTSFSPVAVMVVDAATIAAQVAVTPVLAPKTGE